MLNQLSQLAQSLLEAARNTKTPTVPKPVTSEVRKDVANNFSDAIELAQETNLIDVMGEAYMAARERKLKTLKGLAD